MRIIKIHKPLLIISPALFIAGILLFACLPRNPEKIFNASYAGLVLSACIMAFSIRKPRDLLTEFGLNAVTGKKYFYLISGIAVGVIFAVIYRNYLDISWIPSRLTTFAIIAAVIGAVEELLFRGYLQTQLRKLNIPASIVVATSAHTSYKVLLFYTLKTVFAVNLMSLFIWTFACGLIFGILKERSGSTYAPIAGHAAFDVLVYGDLVRIPWWIWS